MKKMKEEKRENHKRRCGKMSKYSTLQSLKKTPLCIKCCQRSVDVSNHPCTSVYVVSVSDFDNSFHRCRYHHSRLFKNERRKKKNEIKSENRKVFYVSTHAIKKKKEGESDRYETKILLILLLLLFHSHFAASPHTPM